MIRRLLIVLVCVIAFVSINHCQTETASAQNAYGSVWGKKNTGGNLDRFYHYPYVYYPQNYWGNDYYRSADSLYHRYPQEMRIPVYNRAWRNYYPSPRRYHFGHHFLTDVF